jgi:hypothetical protein
VDVTEIEPPSPFRTELREVLRAVSANIREVMQPTPQVLHFLMNHRVRAGFRRFSGRERIR